MQAASVSNPDAARLADVLAEALCTWEQHRGDDGVFTMALPLQGVDPLQQLPLLQQAGLLTDLDLRTLRSLPRNGMSPPRRLRERLSPHGLAIVEAVEAARSAHDTLQASTSSSYRDLFTLVGAIEGAIIGSLLGPGGAGVGATIGAAAGAVLGAMADAEEESDNRGDGGGEGDDAGDDGDGGDEQG